MPNLPNVGDSEQVKNQAQEEPAGLVNIPADSVPGALANAPHPDQTRMYNVVVNGKQESWPLDKLISEAQTSAAGREKFAEAAEIRKDAAKAIAIQEDMDAVFKDGDLDAFRRVGAAYGIPGDEVEKIAQNAFSGETDENVVEEYFKESVENEQKQATRSRSNEPIDYSKLTPDIQRVLREAENTRINGIVQNALDKDEKIAYNMEKQSPEGRTAIRQYVDEKISGRLTSFGGDFGDGARILAEVLPEIREHLQALGTPGDRTLTGLGHAPGGGDTEVHPRQLPEHVSSTEGDDFEQNILETMQYHQDQAERGKQ